MEEFRAKTSFSEVTERMSEQPKDSFDDSSPHSKASFPETSKAKDEAFLSGGESVEIAAPSRSLRMSHRSKLQAPSSRRAGRSGRSSGSTSEAVLIRRDEPPPQLLVLKMYDLQTQLSAVNEQLMSGMAVEESEWEKLRRLSTRLGDTFDNVNFAWKPDELSAMIEEEEANALLLEEGGSSSNTTEDFVDDPPERTEI